MKVAVYPADLGGCGHYRLIYPIEAMQRAGNTDAEIEMILPTPDAENPDDSPTAKLDVIVVDEPAVWQGVTVNSRRVIDVVPPDADVVVLQRPMNRLLVDAIPYLQARGIAVVVEVDDDFDAINARNLAFVSTHKSLNPDLNADHVRRACAMADMVTVSTPALAAVYGKHGRFRVLPNALPPHWFARPETQRYADAPHPWIGWSGTIATHPNDLQVTRGAVGRICHETGAGLYIVGTGKGVRERLGVYDETPFHATEWKPIDEYPDALDGMDVGIVPLEQSRFNRCKSDLKGLEYAALGIPFVASPLPEYERLAATGAGLIADRPREWAGLLRRLVNDQAYREDWRMQGMEAVRFRSYDYSYDLWLEAWHEALLVRRTTRAKAVATVDLNDPRLAVGAALRKAAGLG